MTVTLVIFGILAFLVIPVVTQQIERGSVIKVARDLDNLRTAIRQFNFEVGTYPKFIGQLGNAITTADTTAASVEYTADEVAAWDGPYIDIDVDPALRMFVDAGCLLDPVTCVRATAWNTGFDGRIQNGLQCFDAQSQYPTPCAQGAYLAIRVDGLTGEQFGRINDVIDGENESDSLVNWFDPLSESEISVVASWIEGRLRFAQVDGIDINSTTGIAFYLLTPL